METTDPEIKSREIEGVRLCGAYMGEGEVR